MNIGSYGADKKTKEGDKTNSQNGCTPTTKFIT